MPTWPMKCSMPSPPGLRKSACALTTCASWSRPACSSTPMETTLSYCRSTSQKSAEAAADVDDTFALGQLELAANVVDLVDLGFVDIRRAFLPVTAGVHHQ